MRTGADVRYWNVIPEGWNRSPDPRTGPRMVSGSSTRTSLRQASQLIVSGRLARNSARPNGSRYHASKAENSAAPTISPRTSRYWRPSSCVTSPCLPNVSRDRSRLRLAAPHRFIEPLLLEESLALPAPLGCCLHLVGLFGRLSQSHGASAGSTGLIQRSSSSSRIRSFQVSPSLTAGSRPALTALRIVAWWHPTRRAAAPVERSGRRPANEGTARLEPSCIVAIIRFCSDDFAGFSLEALQVAVYARRVSAVIDPAILEIAHRELTPAQLETWELHLQGESQRGIFIPARCREKHDHRPAGRGEPAVTRAWCPVRPGRPAVLAAVGADRSGHPEAWAEGIGPEPQPEQAKVRASTVLPPPMRRRPCCRLRPTLRQTARAARPHRARRPSP